MAKRGPKPKPTLPGADTVKRPAGNVVDLPSVREYPNPPEWLDKKAEKEWHRVVGELSTTGALKTADFNTLAILCDQWGQYVDDRERGIRVSTARVTEIRRLYSEFHLTPGGRGAGSSGGSPEKTNRFAGHGRKPA